jgi:hypothetical protein
LENKHELLYIGTKNLRKLWGPVAPYWSFGWRLLLELLSSVGEVSGQKKACRRAPAIDQVVFVFVNSHAFREGAMSAATAVLPFVWATEQHSNIPQQPEEDGGEPAAYEMAFYRKYTEGILQRYVRLSMESGKVPSLLGQEMFRGKVTSYRVGSFVDSVIFVHDVAKCIATLDEEQQHLISRIAVQQYTLTETAGLLGLRPRTVVRRYGLALDRLTRVFLGVQMLEPQKCCQGGEIADFDVNN